MSAHPYIAQYPPATVAQVNALIEQGRLGGYLKQRYPAPHSIASDADLRAYAMALKNRYMKKSAPLSKVVYDAQLHLAQKALGLHSYVPRMQGAKVKTKNELRVSALFKNMAEPMLNMIVVHELAHLKEKEHNKAFYRLCQHMLPDYHQLEFDTRLYLIHLELDGSLYE